MDNQDYYDQFAAGYEKERHHGYHVLIDKLELAATLPLCAGAKVLEAGCGTGMILRAVAPVAKSAVGIDLSEGMLAQARARGLDVVHGSVTDMPFGDGEFDVCYSFKVLAHVQDIERALAEMTRVVRPGGHVVAEFYNPYSLRGLIKRLKRPTAISESANDHQVYTRYDTLRDIKRYLPRSLEVTDVRGVRVLTPVSAVHDIPVVAAVLGALEQRAATTPILRRLGGFMVVTAVKR